MSQHDMDVANGAGVAVRADLNLALKALASQSSGTSAPSPAYPCQIWADTGTGRLKQRDSANTVWLDRGALDASRSPFGGYAGIATKGENATLTTSEIGFLIVVTAAGTTQTLPAVSSVPSGSSFTFSIFGSATIKGNASELITSIYGASSSNTVPVSGGERIQVTSNGSSWYISAYDRAEAGSPAGRFSNGKMSVTTASATATFTADEVIVATSLGGQSYRLASFSKVINLASTGAGGMDTGAAPASGFVSIYAIYNPTSGASALLACNQTTSSGNVYTGANMPTGYTASCLVSAWGTTAASLLAIGLQIERQINVALTSINTSTVNQSNTSISMASIVPTAAKEIAGLLQCGSSVQTNATMSLSGTVGGVGSRNVGSIVIAGGVIQGAFSGLSIGTASTVFYTANTAAGALSSSAFLTSYSI